MKGGNKMKVEELSQYGKTLSDLPKEIRFVILSFTRKEQRLNMKKLMGRRLNGMMP